MLIQRLLYQVDINLGFTARGNTMQQRHVFLQKRELYLVKRFLLYIAQRFDMFRMRIATKIQSPHLFIIGFQHTTLHQGVYRLQGVSLVNQLVAGYLELFLGLSQLVPTREFQIIQKSLELLGSTLQHINSHVQGLLAAELRRQLDVEFGTWTITILGFQS